MLNSGNSKSVLPVNSIVSFEAMLLFVSYASFLTSAFTLTAPFHANSTTLAQPLSNAAVRERDACTNSAAAAAVLIESKDVIGSDGRSQSDSAPTFVGLGFDNQLDRF
ncbi:uncharacterized protein UHOD_11976 [Ustilago sp. UG-2017b]|nr:uncharacterized protein UHOD_11976 [Ustilago sp. UG-2017b]